MAQMLQRLAAKGPQLVKSSVDFTKPRLQTFWKYAKVEMRPPSPNEFGQVSDGFVKIMNAAKTGTWKNLTFKEAMVNTLVGIEVGCWFFVGECIGKGNVIGYHIPGAMVTDHGL